MNVGRHKQVRYVPVKKSINRYKTVNLSGKNKHLQKGSKIKIKNYDYSNRHDVNKTGALRYRVIGGYITGNSKYVKVIK